jgi:hypothetical protein
VSVVLSPRPPTHVQRRGAGSDAGSLKGKKVGLRRDRFWRSWDWVTDEWASMLEAEGATPVIWRAPVGKGDKQAVEASVEFEAFLDESDMVITGLCNCGSCTLWAVHDGLAALKQDLPTVFVATEHFERLARKLSDTDGFDDIRVKLLPYPLEGKLEEEVRQIARKNFDEVLDKLGVVR